MRDWSKKNEVKRKTGKVLFSHLRAIRGCKTEVEWTTGNPCQSFLDSKHRKEYRIDPTVEGLQHRHELYPLMNATPWSVESGGKKYEAQTRRDKARFHPCIWFAQRLRRWFVYCKTCSYENWQLSSERRLVRFLAMWMRGVFGRIIIWSSSHGAKSSFLGNLTGLKCLVHMAKGCLPSTTTLGGGLLITSSPLEGTVGAIMISLYDDRYRLGFNLYFLIHWNGGRILLESSAAKQDNSERLI